VADIVELYRADGFLEAAHEGTRLTLDHRAGTAEVEVRLREGVRTVVESVAFEGNAAVPLARLLEETRLRPGDPLSFTAVELTRAALLALYARSGYLYARVQDLEEFGPDRSGAAVRFRVEEGPQVRVARVAGAGNRRTREQVVRSTLELRAGEPYDPGAVARSQTALLRLGVFRSVALRLSDPEVPESEKDLTVELAERPWLSVAPGLGFSLANGPRLFVEYSQPNLFGRALELAARAKVNYPVNVLDQRPDLAGKTPGQRVEGYANVGLHFPRLHILPVPLAVHLDGIGERVHRKAYDMTRVSTVLGGDVAVFSRVGFSLQGELEVDDIRRSTAQGLVLTRADVERLRFPEGVTTLFSLRPVLTLDWRDNSVHPRSGWYAAFGADYARSVATGQGYLLLGLLPGSEVFTDMLKLQVTGSTYLPVGRSLVLALSLRAGRVFPLDRDSKTIGPKRFYLGGASTLRGYSEDELIPQDLRKDFIDQVAACNSSLAGLGCSPAALGVAGGNPPPSEGGEVFVLGKAEARIAIRGSVEAGIFADVGNLWLNPRDANFGELHVSVGLGLRFITPIGPAALDLGFNAAPDRRLAERVYAPHFSIGLF
jgi:outer membrane protein assembly factor BamA